MSIPPQIRPLRREDRDNILVLFQETFASTRTAEWWEWQFLQNPFNRPIVWVAETEEKRLVGHYSLVPVPFWRQGRAEKAGFSIHSMVHPNYQRQGILNKLAEAAEKQLTEDSIETGLTFLNENSFYLYTHKLGWKEMTGSLPVYFSVLEPYDILRRFVKIGFLAKVLALLANPLIRLGFSGWSHPSNRSIKQVEKFDDRVDTLWSEIRKGVLFATDRNSKYLNWRFAGNPCPYALFTFESDDKRILGLAVTRAEEKFSYRIGYIADLLFHPAHPQVALELLKHVKRFLKGQRCVMVTALVSEARLSQVIRRSGFYRLPNFLMPHQIHFCCKDRSKRNETALLTSPAGWYLSWSDHDVV
jgi:predicted N-acetyltransferase YhbS